MVIPLSLLLERKKMPTMVRSRNKGTLIFEEILGVPSNFKEPRKTKKEKRIDRRLTFEESYNGNVR